jgi:hypothetical protein
MKEPKPHLLGEHQRRLSKIRRSLLSIERLRVLNGLDGEGDDGRDGELSVVAVERDGHHRLDRRDLVLEKMRDRLEPPVATSELTEDLDRRVGMMVVERNGLEKVVKGRHEISKDGPEGRIEELGGEVVDAELERSQSLAYELGTGSEGMHEGFHEVAEMREKVRESDGDGEAEFDEEVSLVGFGVEKEVVESVEHLLEDRKDLLVERLESTATDGSEESSEDGVVDGGLRGFGGVAERVGN